MAGNAAFRQYKFIVRILGEQVFGGFSEVAGRQIQITPAEYRAGQEAVNHPEKIQTIQKVSDVTLKRGLVDSSQLWSWIQAARTQGANAKRNVSITLQDESGQPVITWNLQKVVPIKYTGPNLAGKGGGDVAIEELVLAPSR
jgi:phage tail-like protein